jgi:hypothetical protein
MVKEVRTQYDSNEESSNQVSRSPEGQKLETSEQQLARLKNLRRQHPGYPDGSGSSSTHLETSGQESKRNEEGQKKLIGANKGIFNNGFIDASYKNKRSRTSVRTSEEMRSPDRQSPDEMSNSSKCQKLETSEHQEKMSTLPSDAASSSSNTHPMGKSERRELQLTKFGRKILEDLFSKESMNLIKKFEKRNKLQYELNRKFKCLDSFCKEYSNLLERNKKLQEESINHKNKIEIANERIGQFNQIIENCQKFSAEDLEILLQRLGMQINEVRDLYDEVNNEINGLNEHELRLSEDQERLDEDLRRLVKDNPDIHQLVGDNFNENKLNEKLKDYWKNLDEDKKNLAQETDELVKNKSQLALLVNLLK